MNRNGHAELQVSLPGSALPHLQMFSSCSLASAVLLGQVEGSPSTVLQVTLSVRVSFCSHGETQVQFIIFLIQLHYSIPGCGGHFFDAGEKGKCSCVVDFGAR